MCTQDGINYQWSDGSDTLFTHWDAADDDDHMVGDCVYMDTTGGWRRADCEMGLRGALCHVPPPSKSPRLPSVFPPQLYEYLTLLHATAYYMQCHETANIMAVKTKTCLHSPLPTQDTEKRLLAAVPPVYGTSSPYR